MMKRKSIEQVVNEATEAIIRSRRYGGDLSECMPAAFIFDSVTTFDNTPTCGLKAKDIFDEMFPGATYPMITVGDGKGIVYEWLAKNVKSIAEKRRNAISVLLLRREQDKINREILEDIGRRLPGIDADGDFGWDYPMSNCVLFDENWRLRSTPVRNVSNDIVRRMNVDSSSLKMPKPKKMWSGYGRKGFSVTVEWEDGTKTTVTNPNETVTEFSGFCACVAKKIFGSTTKMMKAMEDAQTESKRNYILKEEAKEREKRMRADKQKRRIELHKKAVQEKLREMRIAKEAADILSKEQSEVSNNDE